MPVSYIVICIKIFYILYLNFICIASAILLLAKPSPYGFFALLILAYSSLLQRSSLTILKIVSSSVPASLSVPAAIPSGRSVVSRKTMTGLPRDGASSWIPPLSVRIKYERLKIMKIHYVHRFDKAYAAAVSEHAVCRFQNDRIKVYRINNLYIRILFHYTPYRGKHAAHRLTEVLPPVCGQNNKPAAL